MRVGKSCPLCKLKRLTKFHWCSPLKKWLIVDCLTCRVPMAVWYIHDHTPPQFEVDVVKKRIERDVFPQHMVGYRHEMKKIKDHYHFHILLGGKEDG